MGRKDAQRELGEERQDMRKGRGTKEELRRDSKTKYATGGNKKMGKGNGQGGRRKKYDKKGRVKRREAGIVIKKK